MVTESTAEHSDTRIVCALGADGSPAALALAAQEAQRTGADLHLVHVTADPGGHKGDSLLLEAMSSLHASCPDVRVTRDAVEGGWVAGTLAHTGPVRCVVIERSRQTRLHRLLSGSTADGVALKVAAPVLSVPIGWQTEPTGPHVITVAVQDSEDVEVLVPLAAAEAVSRGFDLVVLHVAAPGHDLGHDWNDNREHWLERGHLQLDAPVRAAVSPFPELKVRLEITAGRPVDAVVHASAGSALLVLGRRAHEHAWGTHLGPVARRALLDASCPVLLAPEPEVALLVGLEQVGGTSAAAIDRVRPGDVMVAVGEDDAGGAVRFAVAEAAARRVGVHLVHVVRMPAVDGVSTAEVWRDAVSHGAALLERAAGQARARGQAGPRVSQRLVERGSRVRSLVDAGAGASVIVVQHRHLTAARRLLTWSITNAIAARSDVTVIAVPADWAAGPEDIGCVVAGLQDRGDLVDVLPAAVEEAVRRRLPLRVVHAGRLSTPEHDAMLAAIAAVRSERPDLAVHEVFEDRYPVDLLVGAVTRAELVVIGRRRHGLSRRSHLGPTARDVLDRSPYPVLLVAPSR